MPKNNLLILAAFLILCLLAAGIGSLFTASSVDSWYAQLEKPAWTPPGWVFGPVWTLLYIMMAIAGWLVYRERGFLGAKLPLSFFLLQLMLNVLWSVIFFGLHRPGLAFLEILALWLAIAITAVLFWLVKPLAGLLLVPYLGWVAFAAILNFAIYRLNAS